MSVIAILKYLTMKPRLLVLLMIMLTVVFAVNPKSKKVITGDQTGVTEVKVLNPDKIDRDDKNDDRFQDADSNGVNDQREDDFKNIKELKSKYKDRHRDQDNKDDDRNQKVKPPEIKINLKKKTRG